MFIIAFDKRSTVAIINILCAVGKHIYANQRIQIFDWYKPQQV